jgi:hypothetical protein
VRNHFARVISDRMCPLKKRPVIAHNKEQSILDLKKQYTYLVCRRVPGSLCSVRVCVSACFIVSVWAWHYEPMLRQCSKRPGFGDGWACLRFGVTLENRQVNPWAWQEVKGESMSINDAVYAGVIESTYTVEPDGRQRWCKEWMWHQWGGVAPCTQEMR